MAATADDVRVESWIRHRAFRLVQNLIRAEAALSEARDALIQASLDLGGLPPGETADIERELERMRHVLFADHVLVADGGDLAAWDLRSIVLRIGEVACNAPPEVPRA
jgi:hypothetical protein